MQRVSIPIFVCNTFSFKVKQEVSISPIKCFNQPFLNVRQKFCLRCSLHFLCTFVCWTMSTEIIINIDMKKVQGTQLTTMWVKQNYKEPTKHLLAAKNAFSFMSTIRRTTTYWLHEVLAMVKRLGILTYFINLSCADLRFHEMPHLLKICRS